MVAKVLVSRFGGIFGVKERANSSSGIKRKFFTTLYYMYQYENGSSVNVVTEFAGRPCLPHDLKAIFISGPARIGKDCVIFHNVTINAINQIDDLKFGAPVVGDSCYISPAVTIMGGCTVGNNVYINANATITEDIPDNSVVEVLQDGSQKITTYPKDQPVDTKYYSHNGRKWICNDGGGWMDVTDEKKLKRLFEVYGK